MPTSIFSVAPTNTSDASFRAWGSAVSTALAAVGLVKTSDTGQIDWTTVLKPASVSAMQGYEIWRFNDSLQSTAPVFLKIEYGSGATIATNPGFLLTIGKGSNGAGTITGVLSTALVGGGAASSTASNWYMSSGDGAMLALAPAPALYTGSGVTTTYWGLVVERSRNPAGAATATGLLFAYQKSGSTQVTTAVNYATGSTCSNVFFPAAVPGSVPLAGGGNTPIFPGIVSDGVGNFWQPRAVLAGVGADIGALSNINVPGFGTYLPITGWNNYDAAGQLTSRAAIWWQ